MLILCFGSTVTNMVRIRNARSEYHSDCTVDEETKNMLVHCECFCYEVFPRQQLQEADFAKKLSSNMLCLQSTHVWKCLQ